MHGTTERMVKARLISNFLNKQLTLFDGMIFQFYKIIHEKYRTIIRMGNSSVFMETQKLMNNANIGFFEISNSNCSLIVTKHIHDCAALNSISILSL